MLRIPFFQSDPERLPVLPDVHPESDRAERLEIGLQTVSVAAITGTVSAAKRERDTDFMPPREARGLNWQARWQRLQHAAQTLAVLPPVDLVQFGNEFWVVDGHNRVALARSTGQLAIDANVTALRVPGSPVVRPQPLFLSTLMEDGRSIRSAVLANPKGAF
jgi:hypothetical protein